MSEDVIKGISTGEGIAIGKVFIYDKGKRKVYPTGISPKKVSANKKIFQDVCKKLSSELDELLEHLDKGSADIIESQKQIIIDPEIERKVFSVIEGELMSVEYAIYSTYCSFIERLEESGSELFKQRIIDLVDIRDRLIDLIKNDYSPKQNLKGRILIAKEVSPTELITLHEQGIEGLVVEKGGITSHASLIAQALAIPCIVNAKHALDVKAEGKAILDGREGFLMPNPSKNQIREYSQKLNKLRHKQKEAQQNLEKLSKTQSGTAFELLANIEFEEEIEYANRNKAAGVGLLRTESLLFNNYSTEEEQQQFYQNVLKGIEGEITVRLFDIGGDKLNARIPDEDNPFLGWRGIRMLLDEEKLLKSQIRALYKTEALYPGRIRILLPMISVVQEIEAVKLFIESVKNDLRNEGINIDRSIPLGIMIEVPSTALIADKLAKLVDFFSIGTNDLTQYTLAVDRGNERICSLYQQHHPAIWKLIKTTADAAHQHGIDISVCGELAGHVLGACGLIGMGIKKLSMASSNILPVKEELVSHTDDEFSKLAESFLCSTSSDEVLKAFEGWRSKRS